MHRLTKIATSHSPRSHRQAGLSLVELMIAMAISLGMIAALVTLMMNNSRTYSELSKTGRQTENGRYAMELLAGDIKLAGFYGELSPNGVTFVDADPCSVAVNGLGFATAPAVTAPIAIRGFVGNVADPAPAWALRASWRHEVFDVDR